MYEAKVAKVSFNGDERDVDRIMTVEIKDLLGTTKVKVSEEAKKKLL